MKILMDIDGVLRDMFPTVIKIYKRDFDPQSNLTVEDITFFDCESLFSKCNLWQDIFIDRGREVFLDSPPYPDVAKHLDHLMTTLAHTRFVICSHQLPENEEYTNQWLENHFIPITQKIYTKDKHMVSGSILVDDSTRNLEKFQEYRTGRISVCMDRPWNKDWKGARIKNLLELEDLLAK